MDGRTAPAGGSGNPTGRTARTELLRALLAERYQRPSSWRTPVHHEVIALRRRILLGEDLNHG